MDRSDIEALLKSVQSGETPIGKAVDRLAQGAVEDLGFAHVDHERTARCGFPEVILASGKSVEQVVAIARALVQRDGSFLATRVSEEQANGLLEAIPGATRERVAGVVYREKADVARTGRVLVISAGTSDIPVAEEARITAHLMGSEVRTCYDAGVAGLHRLLRHGEDLQAANAIVVVAGMEGALGSVVGGLVSVPVIAVPTSVGYGASFNGLAALLGMLNSCSAAVSVVNIDNGFSAGYIAALINRLAVGKG